MKRVAVIGSSGFTGKECIELVERHPELELAAVMSARESGTPRAPIDYPGALREPDAGQFSLEAVAGLDAVLVCAPHESAAGLVPRVCETVGVVVDLSAAFRLTDAALYPRFYGFEHPCPELLGSRIYGLTEWHRDALRSAKLIANPGCYVTSVLLPVLALEAAGCLAPGGDIIADCKSGVSGAGKAATSVTHFASVSEDFRSYAVGTHRHEPEMREQLGHDRLFFVPHLLPVFRGILSTLHVSPRSGLTAADLRAVLAERYAGDPFVSVRSAGEALPVIADVQRSNRCDIGVVAHGDRVVVVSCLDNLVKGAAGQAIQNLNLALGLDEGTGLADLGARTRGWR